MTLNVGRTEVPKSGRSAQLVRARPPSNLTDLLVSRPVFQGESEYSMRCTSARVLAKLCALRLVGRATLGPRTKAVSTTADPNQKERGRVNMTALSVL